MARFSRALFFGIIAVSVGAIFVHASAYTFSHDLKYGDTEVDVSYLQDFLTDQGYFHHSITDYYGPITLAAVKTWQTAFLPRDILGRSAGHS
jgi:peptidoglycan hydrolase-like protein with peptidoglycan-binding domain